MTLTVASTTVSAHDADSAAVPTAQLQAAARGEFCHESTTTPARRASTMSNDFVRMATFSQRY